jgi:Domain of unknown function (DUF4349)
MLLEELERELRAERPELNPEFARRLDEWAAAGFPPGGEVDPRTPRSRGPAIQAWLRGVPERLGAIPPRRLLAPAAAALTLIVAAVVITRSGELDTGSEPAAPLPAQTSPGETAAPSEGVEAGATEAPGGGAAVDRAEAVAPPGAAREIGPRGRRIAQRIDLALATSPEEFRDAADGVLDVAREHRGFVVRSSVSGGDPAVEGTDPGHASFQLRIPALRLQPALAALSELGHVVSRTDGTIDITRRFVSARQRIDALQKERDRLLQRLEAADTATEHESIRARLRIVAAELADAEDDLGRAQTRVRLVPVSVLIAADPSLDGGGDDGWDLDDAADDAVDVLRFVAGVALISVAVLLPLALLGALAWLVAARARTRARERALDR